MMSVLELYTSFIGYILGIYVYKYGANYHCCIYVTPPPPPQHPVTISVLNYAM